MTVVTDVVRSGTVDVEDKCQSGRHLRHSLQDQKTPTAHLPKLDHYDLNPCLRLQATHVHPRACVSQSS